MRRIALLSAVLVLLLSLPALAAEDIPDTGSDGLTEAAEAPEDPVSVETIKTEEEGVTVNVTIAQPETPPADAPPDVLEDQEPVSEPPSDTRTYTVASLDVPEAVPAADGSSAMAQIVVSILGEYQRQTYTVQETDAEGNVIAVSTQYVPGLAGLDYHWIAGALLFGLFLYCVLRMLGGAAK